MKEILLNQEFIKLLIGIQTITVSILIVPVIVKKTQWETFKSEFHSNSLTISGVLKVFRNKDTIQYMVIADDKNAITSFRNVLMDTLNESEACFEGPVTLKKKYSFDTESKLYLKRLKFETLSNHPVEFEAMALRGAAPYFNEIKEGEKMLLKADYVLDKNGNPPYWRIKKRPELL